MSKSSIILRRIGSVIGPKKGGNLAKKKVSSPPLSALCSVLFCAYDKKLSKLFSQSERLQLHTF